MNFLRVKCPKCGGKIKLAKSPTKKFVVTCSNCGILCQQSRLRIYGYACVYGALAGYIGGWLFAMMKLRWTLSFWPCTLLLCLVCLPFCFFILDPLLFKMFIKLRNGKKDSTPGH